MKCVKYLTSRDIKIDIYYRNKKKLNFNIINITKTTTNKD